MRPDENQPGRAFDTLSDHQIKVLGQLVRHRVRFTVIGGYAVRHHGCLRSTNDLDILVENSPANLTRLREALLHQSNTKAEWAEQVIQHLSSPRKKFGYHDVEMVSSMDGLDDQVVHRTAEEVQVPTLGLQFWVISRERLLEAKRLAIDERSHPSDAEDYACLSANAEGLS